ncbi:MAG: type IV pilus twitching motility protein PilT [Longimicrobiales bacterium]
MIEILKAAVQRGASDLHIKAGDVVRARIQGELVPITKQRLNGEQTKQLALQFIPNSEDKARIDDLTDYDCSFGAPGVGRFRVNILRQRGAFSIVLRVIPFDVPSLDELGLPPVLKTLSLLDRGLVLVTGVTGSGKSTTLAAMLHHINQNRRKHIISLEDPIEFLHRDMNSSMTQREVGTDTRSFSTGLRAALREDPDVVLVGEMRDTETIDIAMKAAETGHLVLSTLHTQNAVKTMSRIIAVFPPHEQQMVRVRLSESLNAVMSQRLLPRKDGRGRVAAAEIMVVTGTIRDAIRDPARVDEIHDFIAEGREQYGSQTFDQHLMDLVAQDMVAFDVAKAAASNPADFELKVRTLA